MTDESASESDSADEQVLALLRTRGLSIKNLDGATKQKVREYIERKHIGQGVSLGDIAKLIGNKTSGYTSWLSRQVGVKPRDFEEARLKGIHEKVRKYERRPFDGTDEDKAYLLGIAHGDFHVSRPFGDAVSVSTSTTHPALTDLFTRLFTPYGHIYIYPRYKETNSYEWNIQTILDKSFDFLLDYRDKCREWIARDEKTMLSYLAGLVDAEGNIRIYANPRTVGIVLGIWNTDTGLLQFAYDCFKRLGFRPMKPYRDRPPGGVSSGFHIEMKKAYWRVLLARIDDAQSLLRRLPLLHREKVEMRELALSVAKSDLYERAAEKISSLKKSIHNEVHRYTRQAEIEFLERHPADSNPVLCLLQRSITCAGLDEHLEKILMSTRGAHAVHVEELCLQDEPCVLICRGCHESNIVSILVHESIHHALLWMSSGLADPIDPLDDIVPLMRKMRIREQGY